MLYSPYAGRMLLLSAELGLNTGPTEDTQLLISGMVDVKDELKQEIGELVGLTSE